MKDRKFNPDPILKHPDRDEIISKLLADFDIQDIVDWLKAKYPNDKSFHLSKPYLTKFKNEHLDLYCTLKEDLQKTYSKSIEPNQELDLTIQNNTAYQDKLQKYLDHELDLQTILRKAIARVEYRIDQIYEEVIEDPRNTKPDRVLNEWIQTLLGLCEKFRPIIDGPQANINIQNNINVQVVDKYANMIGSLLKEVVAEIDHESGLLVIERFTHKLAELKEETTPLLPQEQRIEEAQILSMEVKENLKTVE